MLPHFLSVVCLVWLLSLFSLVVAYQGYTIAFSPLLGLTSITIVIVTGLSYGILVEVFGRLVKRFIGSAEPNAQAATYRLYEAIARSADFHGLILSATDTIKQHLGAAFCNLHGSADFGSKGLNQIEFTSDDLRFLHSLPSGVTIAIESLGSSEERLRTLMHGKRIALIVRFRTAQHSTEQGAVFLLVGAKTNSKRGNSYSKQEMQWLASAADALRTSIERMLEQEKAERHILALRGKANQAIKEQRHNQAQLKSLDETKDEFISMASHQLRTPLTSVKGYVSMVLEGDAGKITPLQRKLLDQAFVSAQRMVYLISDLLNVSRLRTGKFIIETKPVNLAQLADEEIEQLLATAKGRGLELTYQKPSDVPDLLIDEVKIRQVVMNFIDNAIYYTPTGGHISVEVTDKKQNVELRVKDNGMGVPKHDQHQLFTKFYRAGNARKARPDGTGLGLFMAQKIIIAHKGAIIFHSQEGKGSTFGFIIPKTHPEAGELT